MDRFSIFREALSIKTAKDLRLTKRSSPAYRYKKFNDVFGSASRIIIKENIDLSLNVKPSQTYYEIKNILRKHGFNITLKDYIENKVLSNKNVYKIGKILQKIDLEMLENFKKDPIRNVKSENYKIIISRHPYDIAGMSTDRSWSSCMEIPFPTGSSSRCAFIKNDIRALTIIAYLVRQEDSNINKPLSRILIKSAIPIKGDSDNNNLMFGVGPVYGAQSTQFTDIVSEWVKTYLNYNLDPEEDYYPNPVQYSDGLEIPGYETHKNYIFAYNEYVDHYLRNILDRELSIFTEHPTANTFRVIVNLTIPLPPDGDVKTISKLTGLQLHKATKIDNLRRNNSVFIRFDFMLNTYNELQSFVKSNYDELKDRIPMLYTDVKKEIIKNVKELGLDTFNYDKYINEIKSV